MPNELAGQVAVVTGGGHGFGRTISEYLAAEGAAVAITARTAGPLEETVAAIEAAGGRALAIPGDVSKREDVERVKRETEAAFGPVTTVVHNAGVPWPFGPIWEVDPDTWWEAQGIHVRGAFLYMNTFVPDMIERGGGRVIVISSTASQRVGKYLSGYCVAKHTQNRLVEHLAAEGAEHNIFTWALHPGSVYTGISVVTQADPMAQKYLPDFVDRLEHQKHEADPEPGLRRCAEVCVILASGRGDALSGKYLEPEWDLDAMVREAAPAASS
jgi:NAD(P)-dependent dehydrogenase (short-subunit alcohol dehydrogenase family)